MAALRARRAGRPGSPREDEADGGGPAAPARGKEAPRDGEALARAGGRLNARGRRGEPGNPRMRPYHRGPGGRGGGSPWTPVPAARDPRHSCTDDVRERNGIPRSMGPGRAPAPPARPRSHPGMRRERLDEPDQPNRAAGTASLWLRSRASPRREYGRGPGEGGAGGLPGPMLRGLTFQARPISVHEYRGSRVASTGVQGGPRLPSPGPSGDADAPGRGRRDESRAGYAVEPPSTV